MLAQHEGACSAGRGRRRAGGREFMQYAFRTRRKLFGSARRTNRRGRRCAARDGRPGGCPVEPSGAWQGARGATPSPPAIRAANGGSITQRAVGQRCPTARPSTCTRCRNRRDEGQDLELRRHRAVDLGARPQGPPGQRRARLPADAGRPQPVRDRLHQPAGGRLGRHVLRRDHRPLRQPDRQPSVHARRHTRTTCVGNNGPNNINTLHGGPNAYNTQVWQATPPTTPDGAGADAAATPTRTARTASPGR